MESGSDSFGNTGRNRCDVASRGVYRSIDDRDSKGPPPHRGICEQECESKRTTHSFNLYTKLPRTPSDSLPTIMSSETIPTGDRASAGSQDSSSPGPSFAQPTQSSKTKDKAPTVKRPRDERDFSNADVLRGVIQSLEEKQARSERRNADHLENLIGQMTESFTERITKVLDRLDRVERIGTQLSIESSPTSRSPSKTRSPAPAPAPAASPASPPQQTFLNPNRITPESSSTPSAYAGRSKITDKFEYLDDGKSPTFRHWKISIIDRLSINADHYTTGLTKKALIWSTTTGDAHRYLEPRYQSGTPNEYRTAEEMIETLKSSFTTGHEQEDFREEFHDMEMCKGDGNIKETFSQFAARFRNLAILGNIYGDDWFYQMWNKITPQLRNAATALKHTWNSNFNTMVNALTSIDIERRRNFERNPTSTSRNAPSGGNNKLASNSGATNKSVAKPFRPFTSSGTGQAPVFKPTVKFSTSPILPSPKSTTQPLNKDNCHLCGKPGHWKRDCPNLPAIKAMIREMEPSAEDIDIREDFDDESEDIQEGNEEA